MSRPAKLQNTRHLLTYIPRDRMRLRARVLIGGWSGHFEEVDVQLELFTPEQTGAATPRTEIVEVAVDSFGTGPAYRLADLEPSLWVGADESRWPVPVAYLSDTGRNPAYPREWRTDGALAAEVLHEAS